MQMKNVANTGVLHWGNKLLALYEVRIEDRGLRVLGQDPELTTPEPQERAVRLWWLLEIAPSEGFVLCCSRMVAR